MLSVCAAIVGLAAAAFTPVGAAKGERSRQAQLVSIKVVPSAPQIARGTKQKFTAIGNYSDGSQQDLTGQAQWASLNTAVAKVSKQGVATGTSPGAARIRASVSSVHGATKLTVTSATLVSITLSPANPAVAKGGHLQMSAIGKFSDGSSQDLSAYGQSVWSSANRNVATVNQTGLVTGVNGGQTTIKARARVASLEGSATLFVGN